MDRRIIQPTSVHDTQAYRYSHVSQVGQTLYLAGQVALDRQGRLVGKGDIRAQTRQVYGNIQSILQELGGDMQDIVKLTTYLTDRSDLQGFRDIRDQTLTPPYPPNTLVFVSGLSSVDYLIEIEAIAVLKPA